MTSRRLNRRYEGRARRLRPLAGIALVLMLAVVVPVAWGYDHRLEVPSSIAVIPCIPGAVNINGVPTSAVAASLLAGLLHEDVVPPGCYWYDRNSGAWGLVGGPVKGQIMAGLDLGGPLPVGASAGDTSVFVNGRELPRAELLAFRIKRVRLAPGSYWLDARGNVGVVGQPARWQLTGDSDVSSDAPPTGHVYQSPDGSVGVMHGDCVMMSVPGYSATSSGCDD